jgi:hypothetical protein
MSDLLASYFDLTVTMLGILGVTYDALRVRSARAPRRFDLNAI